LWNIDFNEPLHSPPFLHVIENVGCLILVKISQKLSSSMIADKQLKMVQKDGSQIAERRKGAPWKFNVPLSHISSQGMLE